METAEKGRVIGELILKYEWHESSSSSSKEAEGIKLIPGVKDDIILEEFKDEWNIIKSSDNNKTQYSISVDVLIKLIKKYGIKL